MELINALIASGSPVKRQQAIELTQKAYGIGFTKDAFVYNALLGKNDEAETNPGRPPQIGSSAFSGGAGSIPHLRLALTLAHENLHRQQFRRLGDFQIATALETMDRDAAQALGAKEYKFQEAQAYQSEIENLKAYRLVLFPDGEIPEDVEAALAKYERDARQKRDHFINSELFTAEEKSAMLRGDFREAIDLIRRGAPGEAFDSYENQLEKQSYFHPAPVADRATARNTYRRIKRLQEKGRTKTSEYTGLVSRLDKLTDRYGLEVLD